MEGYPLPQMDEVYYVITYRRTYQDKRIDQQIVLVLDKQEKPQRRQQAKAQGPNRDELKVLDCLIKPIHTQACEQDRQA